MGASALQGPHQAAQKSTMTGCSDFNTNWSKLASVTSTIASLAILPPEGSLADSARGAQGRNLSYHPRMRLDAQAHYRTHTRQEATLRGSDAFAQLGSNPTLDCKKSRALCGLRRAPGRQPSPRTA